MGRDELGARRAAGPGPRDSDGEVGGARGGQPALRRVLPVPIARAGGMLAVVLLLITTGCGLGASIPNPFASESPTPMAAPTPTRADSPTPASTPGPAAAGATPTFTSFWVKNHRLTEMWSGETNAPGVVSFGTTSHQFCSFLVALPPQGPRLYVFNPYSQNYFWIEADAVGPVGPPERRPGSPPSGQNCAEAVYEG